VLKHAVGKGSNHGPRLITVSYYGAEADEPPISLVGKGITYDSGGYSIKSKIGMQTMKYDISGFIEDSPIIFSAEAITPTIFTGSFCLEIASTIPITLAAPHISYFIVCIPILDLILYPPVGVIASAENMIGESSMKPDDVFTALNGETVEMLNSDEIGKQPPCHHLKLQSLHPLM
jgi:leucyl aminopeptidase